MMGTPAYMAPEQVRGLEIDHRADLYAMAVASMAADGPPALQGGNPNRDDSLARSDAPTPPRELRAQCLSGSMPHWSGRWPKRRPIAASPPRSSARRSRRDWAPSRPRGSTPAPTCRPARNCGGGHAESTRMPPPVAHRPRTRPIPLSAATHTPTAVRVARGETTVTLRTPHLAMAAVLLALLVVGVGVLGYVALRRPPAPAEVASSVPEPDPARRHPPRRYRRRW